MWLINTKNLSIWEFSTNNRPKYAILSHRWENEEISFQEFRDPARRRKAQGYQKVVRFCREAKHDGLDWAWIDTCCIDKQNSTELSEAINSMFSWYRDSTACYIYLHDFANVSPRSRPDSQLRDILSPCEWFTRAWTLQELIAPSKVLFFDQNWRYFGNKQGLADEISSITRIDPSLLRGKKSLYEFSCAQKMSWAARRKSKRPEDRAYSLFGLFGITMPSVYGEGHEAFRRLQEAILIRCPDHTLFAWTLEGWEEFPTPYALRRLNPYSVLAPSPDCFYASCSVVPFDRLQVDQFDLGSESSHSRSSTRERPDELRLSSRNSYPTMSGGLRIQLMRRYIGDVGCYSMYEAMLDCYDELDPRRHACTICLVRRENASHVQRAEPYYLGKINWRDNSSPQGFFRKDFLFRPAWTSPDDSQSTHSEEMEKQVQTWKDRAASRIKKLHAETIELNLQDRRLEFWTRHEVERIQVQQREEKRLEEPLTLHRIASTESFDLIVSPESIDQIAVAESLGQTESTESLDPTESTESPESLDQIASTESLEHQNEVSVQTARRRRRRAFRDTTIGLALAGLFFVSTQHSSRGRGNLQSGLSKTSRATRR